MARKEEFYFNSASGTTKIHGIRYIPDGDIKAILQISHGMLEYIERYESFALFLASKGILVTGNDHLGHGKSINSKEDLGYFAKENGNKSVLYDLYQLTQITKEHYPDVPYFLLGHSMGSFYARQYLAEFGNELQGAIIMGTGCQPLALVQAGRLLTVLISLFKGWNYRSTLVSNIAFAGYNKRFQPQRTSKDWLTKDTVIVDKYIADECCSFIFTLNAFYNMFTGISRLYNKNLLNKMPKNLPVFFVAGQDDPVGDYGKGIYKVSKMFQDMGMKNTQIKLYANDRHEILNETDREQVYNDIYEWINSLLS